MFDRTRFEQNLIAVRENYSPSRKIQTLSPDLLVSKGVLNVCPE